VKIVLEIQDSKADFILKWLKQYAYVKINPGKKDKKDALKTEGNALDQSKKINTPKKRAPKPNKIQKLLLKGPVMTDSQYKDFLEKRKHFSAWK
jgi:hypothetical protein